MSALSDAELAQIFANIAYGADFIDDLRKYPASSQAPNPAGVIAWMDAAP